MLVLVDIEWIEQAENELELTQISALRVDGNWSMIDRFDAIVKPEHLSEQDPENMGFNGYERTDFEGAASEIDVAQQFFLWMEPEDIICVWHWRAKKYLKILYRRVSDQPMPYQCFPVNNRVYELFRKRGINEYSLYRLADKMEISMAGVQHCSYNDVGVMQELFSKLGHDELFVPENVKVQLSEKEKKERVLRKIQESKYAFLFTPESKIFHLKSCPRMKNAKILNGCDSFKAAVKKRRPCKVCNPQPPMLDEMEGSLPKLAESAKAADKPKLSECVRVKVVDGSTGVVYRSRIAGFCHYIQHPGAVTKSALEKHQCVEKECRHFEKFEDSPVWLNLEAEARRKAAAKRARKRKKQIEKREEQKLADEQEQIRSLIQESADAAGEAMIVIRVQRESGNRYLVNYVSENHFADGNRFPGMFEKLKEKNPRLRLYLRHMKDLKGHFVTIEEYKRLKRPKN